MASPGRKIDRGTPTRWAVRVPTTPPPLSERGIGEKTRVKREERRKKRTRLISVIIEIEIFRL